MLTFGDLPLHLDLVPRRHSQHCLVPPAALRTWVIVQTEALLSRLAEQLDIWVVRKLLAEAMRQAGPDVPRLEVNDVVRAKHNHDNKNVDDNEDAERCHLVPLHGQVLAAIHDCGADMA